MKPSKLSTIREEYSELPRLNFSRGFSLRRIPVGFSTLRGVARYEAKQSKSAGSLLTTFVGYAQLGFTKYWTTNFLYLDHLPAGEHATIMSYFAGKVKEKFLS